MRPDMATHSSFSPARIATSALTYYSSLTAWKNGAADGPFDDSTPQETKSLK